MNTDSIGNEFRPLQPGNSKSSNPRKNEYKSKEFNDSLLISEELLQKMKQYAEGIPVKSNPFREYDDEISKELNDLTEKMHSDPGCALSAQANVSETAVFNLLF